MSEHAPTTGKWYLHRQPRDLLGPGGCEYSIWFDDEIVIMADPIVTNDGTMEQVVAILNNHDALVKALENVRSIIADGAMTGFNYKDGDWAERLFASQQVTSQALAKVQQS